MTAGDPSRELSISTSWTRSKPSADVPQGRTLAVPHPTSVPSVTPFFLVTARPSAEICRALSPKGPQDGEGAGAGQERQASSVWNPDWSGQGEGPSLEGPPWMGLGGLWEQRPERRSQRAGEG